MNETTILGLWSASKTLADCNPLNKAETVAVKELLDCVLSHHVPTTQEIKRYKECKTLVTKCDSDAQKAYFQPTIEKYEQKYSFIK
ncbi:hypothetical protein [Enterococcus sp. 5H]|uniref:hypothetical protein n=1 Tax=Enterococcus sp. 5H TaxID=1229490 RepID=UPI002303FB9D|nr:hypothetical protein [Enterococcus sp. 5H]MDA9469875.1 hypothetical protein [Enterococcus sp. 5H]